MKQTQKIESLIVTVRGQRVILDTNLAELYGVPTKRLNEQVKRNPDRFPEDFCFQLSATEWDSLRSQFATLNENVIGNKGLTVERPPRSVSKSGRGRHRKYLPLAFTEHGAIMAANVISSREAVAMSVYVVRAFVQMREQIAANAEILKRLAEIDKTLLKHDRSLQIIWSQLEPLLNPAEVPPKRRIGFESSKD